MAKEQNELEISGPGVTPVRIRVIDNALDEYIPLKEKRCKLTPQEVAAKLKVIEKMHEHADKLGKNGDGSLVYRRDDTLIVLKPGREKLSLRDANDDGEEEED